MIMVLLFLHLNWNPIQKEKSKEEEQEEGLHPSLSVVVCCGQEADPTEEKWLS